MAEKLTVFISSTVPDLQPHRDQARNACLRCGMFPEAMDAWHASDKEGVRESLTRVDAADLFVGILGMRYGYVPSGETRSVTEMEYERATERGIPCLMFLIDPEKHLIRPDIVETGPGADALRRFKDKVLGRHTIEFFLSPEDLRGKIVDALKPHERRSVVPSIHHVAPIPAAPHPYVAHRYTLLETGRLIGRAEELNRLDRWGGGLTATNQPVYCLRAIGGMGKSALLWHWFHEHAAGTIPELAGRIWWSFYESDASFSNFLRRATAYVTGLSPVEVEQMPPPDREEVFLRALEERPFLIALDGLERELLAYSGEDTARLTDEQVDELSRRREPSDDREQHLCWSQDPALDRLLERLVRMRSSRVLVSTRLLPTALRKKNGDPLPGCHDEEIEGLSNEDALELWRAFAGGRTADVLELLVSFGKHPLLIQTLAAEVGRFRPAPGDFLRWCAANPKFDPFALPLKQRKSRVLAFALRGLSGSSRRTLETIAAFRMPAAYDLLEGLLLGPGRIFDSQSQLDASLTDLEERALVGWDRAANRYDLHPLVRGVVWSATRGATKLLGQMHSHFGHLPAMDQAVSSVDDLALSIEMYNCLIGLRRYPEAEALFRGRLLDPLYHHLSAYRQVSSLLEELRDPAEKDQSGTYRHLMQYLMYAQEAHGDYVRAESAHRIHARTCNAPGCDLNLVRILRARGQLREAEAICRRWFDLPDMPAREAEALLSCSRLLRARGEHEAARELLRRARSGEKDWRWHWNQRQQEEMILAIERENVTDLARCGALDEAKDLASNLLDRALKLGYAREVWLCRVRLADVLMDMEAWDEGRALALEALKGFRTAGDLSGEAEALCLLARERRAQGDDPAAHALLSTALGIATRTREPARLAATQLALAEVEIGAGNRQAAAQAAAAAYTHAWCEGPPYALVEPLRKAGELLDQLGQPLPRKRRLRWPSQEHQEKGPPDSEEDAGG